MRAALLGGALVALLAVPGAQAAYTITVQQVGGDVVATGSGSLDVTSFGSGTADTDSAQIGTTNGNSFVYVGGSTDGSALTAYSDEGNPIGGGDPMFGVVGEGGYASSASGDLVGLVPANLFNFDSDTVLYVPQGYVSGAPLSGTATWEGATINSLGLFAGTYVWTWGDSAAADSFTLVIVAPDDPGTRVPEPGTALLLGAGVLGLGAVRRCRPTVAA
jgi:hypothetical protein